jgi:hypothetical protein
MKLTSEIKNGRARFFGRIRTFHAASAIQAVAKMNALQQGRMITIEDLLEMPLGKWEVWSKGLFIGFVLTEAEADAARESGCTVVDKSL